MLTPNPPSYYLRVGEKLRILSREELTMKKVITILAILALAVGMIFADDPQTETHTLRIKSVVDTVRPAFQLVLSEASTNGNKSEFDGTGSYPATNDGAIEVFSINDGGDVTFSAILVNQTNTKEAFKLSFSGGEFLQVTRYGESGTRGPSKITTSVGTVISAANSNTDKGIASIAFDATASSTETNKPVIITFAGQLDLTVFKATTEGVTIATAKYEYPQDKTIDAGTYYADVILTVATV